MIEFFSDILKSGHKSLKLLIGGTWQSFDIQSYDTERYSGYILMQLTNGNIALIKIEDIKGIISND